MAKTVNEWYDVYVSELAVLEATSDEEAIKKEVAEFEAKLRESYAEKKNAKIEHLKTAISIMEETSLREKEEEEAELAKQLEEEISATETEKPFENSTVSIVEELPNMDNPFGNL